MSDDSDNSDAWRDDEEESEFSDSSQEEEVVVKRRNFFSKKVEEKKHDIIYSLVWNEVKTSGVPPSPRQGHTMTTIADILYVFGGSDGKRSFDTLYTLDASTMEWRQPNCSGTIPKPRQRHGAVGLPNRSLMVWGGIGGGGEVYMLDTKSFTWFQARCQGDENPWGRGPKPRWGHTMVIVGQAVLVIGGHDGRDSLDEVWQLDLTEMRWDRQDINGVAPLVGAKHTSQVIKKKGKVTIVGGPEQGAFHDVHSLHYPKKRWDTVGTTGDVPPSRSRHVSHMVNTNLFMFGGVGGGRAMNDVRVLQMGEKPPIWVEPLVGGVTPSARFDSAMDLVEDKQGMRLIVFGGNDGLMPLNDVFALVTMTWSEVKAAGTGFPLARVGCTVTSVGTKLYVLGGGEDGAPQNDVRVFNTETESWTIPPVSGHPPNALIGHSTVCVGEELLVFGGGDGKADGNTLMVYDTSISAWEDPPTDGQVPIARYGHAAVLHNQNMYTFGGYSVKVGYSNDLYMLDVGTLIWHSPYVNGQKPSERVSHAMVLVGNRIFIYGGSNTDAVFSDVHTLDLTTMSWSAPQIAGDERLMPAPRFNHWSCVCGSKIFCYGGLIKVRDIEGGRKEAKRRGWKRHTSNVACNSLHVLDTDKMKWDDPLVAGTSPGPRFRHATLALGTKVYIFGGKWGGNSVFVLETGIEAAVTAGVARRKRGAYQKRNAESKHTVLDWLGELNLEKYARSFVKSEIDWESVLELTDKDLKDMGVIALGPRKKLQTAIEKKKAGGAVEMQEEELADAEDLYQKRYKMERIVNYGAITSVSLSLDLRTKKRVILKFIANKDDFRNEVEFLKDLRSEYVANMIDYYEDDEGDSNCIVLEYATLDLARYLKDHKLNRNERKFLLDRIARILEHLHSRNVVHCDFKPSNICLFGTKWKVIDLATATRTGDIVPPAMTPMYCTPEMAKAVSQKKVHLLRAAPAMDVWGLGIVMVEVFTRRHFLRTERPDTMKQLMNFELLEVPADHIDDPQALHLINQMLAKNVSDRASIRKVLRHAFFVGGMDTEQLDAAFTFLKDTQGTLQADLSAVTQTIDEQSEREKEYIRKAKEQVALEKKLAKLKKSNQAAEGDKPGGAGPSRSMVDPTASKDSE